MVKLHGGKLTVDSKEGDGSTFTFTLALPTATLFPGEPVPPSRAAPPTDTSARINSSQNLPGQLLVSPSIRDGPDVQGRYDRHHLPAKLPPKKRRGSGGKMKDHQRRRRRKRTLHDFSVIRKVLVVDDNAINRKVATHMLENLGVASETA
jgi:CheY-like chemotaxis protein